MNTKIYLFSPNAGKYGSENSEYGHFSLSVMLMLRIIESCHGYNLIATLEGLICIHHSTNTEAAIQLCSLKYNIGLNLHPNMKVHIKDGLLFCKHNGTL